MPIPQNSSPRAARLALSHLRRMLRGAGSWGPRGALARVRFHAARAPRGSRVRSRAARSIAGLRAASRSLGRVECGAQEPRVRFLAGCAAERQLARVRALTTALESRRAWLTQKVAVRAWRALRALERDLPVGLAPRWAAAVEAELAALSARFAALTAISRDPGFDPHPAAHRGALSELAACLAATDREREHARRLEALAIQVRGCRRTGLGGLRARALVRAVRDLMRAGVTADDPRLLACLQHHTELLRVHVDLAQVAAQLPVPSRSAYASAFGGPGRESGPRRLLAELRERTYARRVLILAPGPDLPLRGQLEAWLAPERLVWHVADSRRPLARLDARELPSADLIVDLHGLGAEHLLLLARRLDPARQLFAAPGRASHATALLAALHDELLPLRPAA